MSNVNINTGQKKYDAIVVGSGMTGGWAAKELSEKGLDTLVLERGRHVEHGEDYMTEHMPSWEMPYRGEGDHQKLEEEYPIQSKAGPADAYTRHWYVKDHKHPYSYNEENPFYWIRGYHLGGRSLCWGRHVPRRCDLGFEANARDGHGIDWPIRYKHIAPWYDYVERFIGVCGNDEEIETLPPGDYLPPMEMNCAEQRVKEGIESTFSDRQMVIQRKAVLTEDHNGRAACHYCGPCSRGCSTGSYFSSLSSTLPAAQATGNLTLECDSIVHSVIYDHQSNRATGVRVIDRNTNEHWEVHGRLVFLCAGALSSTQILLNSKTSRFPEGLGNSSGVLGHYLMDHPFRAGASGTVPGLEDKYYYGARPVNTYISRFQNMPSDDRQRDYLRGYCFVGGASRSSWERGTEMKGLGEGFKNKLRDPGPWEFSIGAFGEMLPRYENYVELDPDHEDDWGIPILNIHCEWSENEKNMRDDMAVSGARMLEAVGLKDVEPYKQEESPPGLCIHEMGTARMGEEPRESVLNEYNQSHDIPNLFVTDGAAMTSSAWKDPSLTYMALTARACDYAVKEMRRDNL